MKSNRCRLRDLGISIGKMPTGPLNSLTDVQGVKVGIQQLFAAPESKALEEVRFEQV